jgi:acyl-coenzyme A synthetase/AMP-(fatty) acid ligase/acyl carrier protein
VIASAEGFKELVNGLRLVILGGEPINGAMVERSLLLNNNLKVLNHYGPTESTIGCICWMINKDNVNQLRGASVIGKSISNVKTYILNNERKSLPIGSPGELCISGDGLAAGYLNAVELTNVKFIDHPFESGKRLYLTGDLASRREDGAIVFYGRIDDQVKINGYRIELGEIQATLQKHENVKECVVLSIKENEEKYICAYVTLWEGREIENLKYFMSRVLPEYMVPRNIIILDEIPLSSNGKINRYALPKPKKIDENHITPANKIEENIRALWAKILHMPEREIGVESNFFLLGGSSLKAMSLVLAIERELEVEITIRDVFTSTTIRQLSDHICYLKDKEESDLLTELDKMSGEELETLLNE